MNISGYSDSEGSDQDTVAPPSSKTGITSSKPASAAKPAFKKVVDRTNPSKIRLNLPTPASEDATTERPHGHDGSRPSKRPRLGGFNAMLPAPKRTGTTPAGTGGPVEQTERAGLGRGVSLKTGAQPAFSREAPEEPTTSEYTSDHDHTYEQREHPAEVNGKPAKDEEVKLVGKATMFRPLSVTNKNKKKKKTATELMAGNTPVAVDGVTGNANETSTQRSRADPTSNATRPRAAKVSLFSLTSEDAEAAGTGVDFKDGIIVDEEYPASDTFDQGAFGAGDEIPEGGTAHANGQSSAHPQQPAESFGEGLNLSAADKRRMFGRKAAQAHNTMPTGANVLNINMNQQYAANEAARTSGEAAAAVQQNRGVRAIAPGKHSLKQLLNAATGQKDELEESFAQGKRNKREAGNKYGWG